MPKTELLFVTGCNAAGKSSLIRSHLSEFKNYEVIMTDVYKERSRQVFSDTVKARKSIILETPFNDEAFKGLIDEANFTYVQKFAEQAYRLERLNRHDLDAIAANQPYRVESKKVERSKEFRMS